MRRLTSPGGVVKRSEPRRFAAMMRIPWPSAERGSTPQSQPVQHGGEPGQFHIEPAPRSPQPVEPTATPDDLREVLPAPKPPTDIMPETKVVTDVMDERFPETNPSKQLEGLKDPFKAIEQKAREQAAKEQASKEPAAKEKAAKEKRAKEQKANERGARDVIDPKGKSQRTDDPRETRPEKPGGPDQGTYVA